MSNTNLLDIAMNEIARIEREFGKRPVRIECGAVRLDELKAAASDPREQRFTYAPWLPSPFAHAVAGSFMGIPICYAPHLRPDEWSLVFR
jgi:hypothetical protein